MIQHFHDAVFQLQQLASLDKAAWGVLGYACYLYIIMDGATRSSSRRYHYRNFYRHRR